MLSNSSRLLLEILEEVGGTKAVAISIMERHNDFSGLIHLDVEPSRYVNPVDYFRDAQALALVSKFKDLKVAGVDRKQNAILKWYEAEHQCYKSNERLNPFLFNSFVEEDKAISAFFAAVRKKIESWIGSRPPSLDRVEGRFGPGATFSDRGRLTTVPDKMTSVPTLTTGAYWYILPYLESMWGRSNVSSSKGLDFVRGNRFATVPKTWKTDRAIAIEPAINVFYQLGFGTSIRKRLLANTGWNLDSAQDTHRAIARSASLTGEFATLDLSSASDTVSRNLVKLLLPPRWFEELDALRSPSTFVDGHWVQLEKFSSMGNGYTFELETIIFAAISSAWLEECGHGGILGSDLFVFGDDIIVPTETASSLVSVLSFCGFSINKSKSFINGPFRESCGGDYWLGLDVRPWFRKEPWVQPLDLVSDINSLRKALVRLSDLIGSPSSYRSWHYMLEQIPLPYRNYRGPEQLGDCVIHDDESRWRFRWKDSIRLFRTVVNKSRSLPWHHWRPEIVLACAVYGVGDGRLGITPRDPSSSYRSQWAPFS